VSSGDFLAIMALGLKLGCSLESSPPIPTVLGLVSLQQSLTSSPHILLKAASNLDTGSVCETGLELAFSVASSDIATDPGGKKDLELPDASVVLVTTSDLAKGFDGDKDLSLFDDSSRATPSELTPNLDDDIDPTLPDANSALATDFGVDTDLALPEDSSVMATASDFDPDLDGKVGHELPDPSSVVELDDWCRMATTSDLLVSDSSFGIAIFLEASATVLLRMSSLSVDKSLLCEKSDPRCEE
jgi:hypothetical protein